ncbi:MAG: biotin transport system substrate-specific component [Paracoccaceae bacterium]|jgi:biotin transport system substrate-specific component
MERQVTYISLFAALIAALGLAPQFALLSGVPITAQSLGVMLSGTVLGAKRGALAVLVFLLLVAMGFPLLAGGRGGLGVFQSPSVGFLIGFPVAAFVAGWVTSQRRFPLFWAAIMGAILGGVLVLYAFGITGMAIILGKSWTEAAPLALPYLVGDAIKALLAGIVTHSIARLRPMAIMSRA